jgi:hypothetical protein
VLHLQCMAGRLQSAAWTKHTENIHIMTVNTGTVFRVVFTVHKDFLWQCTETLFRRLSVREQKELLNRNLSRISGMI